MIVFFGFAFADDEKNCKKYCDTFDQYCQQPQRLGKLGVTTNVNGGSNNGGKVDDLSPLSLPCPPSLPFSVNSAGI